HFRPAGAALRPAFDRSAVPARSRHGERARRAGAGRRARQPDLPDRAHLLHGGAASSRLRKALLPGRSDPVFHPPVADRAATVMEASVIFWLFAAAFGASALGGVLGMASGIFIVP